MDGKGTDQMEHRIENEALTLTVAEHGAELRELGCKAAPDAPLLWDGQEGIWPRRAPICFPWCGRVEDNWYEFQGKRYEGLPQHGFARDRDHALVGRTEDSLTFRLDWPGDDKLWPWAFTLETCHALKGTEVETICAAVNRSDKPMPVQLGFHVGLRCPFTPGKKLEDYMIRFERSEAPGGTEVFPLDCHSFDNDSLCFPGLHSAWVQVEERDTGKYLRIETEGWPFVLLWSAVGVPGFVCIEPWTGYLGPGHDLGKRPGALWLEPGECFTRPHRLTVGL